MSGGVGGSRFYPGPDPIIAQVLLNTPYLGAILG